MTPVYDQSALCVVSSKTEGMPRTRIEAAASGVPVVASRIPQINEFDRQGVLLFEPDSVSDLARCIISMLENQKLALAMSRRARQLAESTFDWEHTLLETSKTHYELIVDYLKILVFSHENRKETSIEQPK